MGPAHLRFLFVNSSDLYGYFDSPEFQPAEKTMCVEIKMSRDFFPFRSFTIDITVVLVFFVLMHRFPCLFAEFAFVRFARLFGESSNCRN